MLKKQTVVNGASRGPMTLLTLADFQEACEALGPSRCRFIRWLTAHHDPFMATLNKSLSLQSWPGGITSRWHIPHWSQSKAAHLCTSRQRGGQRTRPARTENSHELHYFQCKPWLTFNSNEPTLTNGLTAANSFQPTSTDHSFIPQPLSLPSFIQNFRIYSTF